MQVAAAPSAKIGSTEISRADERRQAYAGAKAIIDHRIQANEIFYRRRYWQAQEEQKRSTKFKPRSAWLLNSLSNKHADAMDQMPEPNVLPRAQDDEGAAKMLSGVLPTVLEQADFEAVYRALWWDKLKHGASICAVTWDSTKLNGLGDVALRRVDPLTICWEPGVRDIQDSRDVFVESVVRADELQARYPEYADRLKGGDVKLSASYIQDQTVDMTDKIVVVDWYYKSHVQGRTALHYCKYAAGVVLYASEDDPRYTQSGYYADGLFPFIFDVLYPIEDSPYGFGYIDVMQDTQIFIDRLDGVMLENAVLSSKKRYLMHKAAGVSREDFTDYDKDIVEYTGSLDAGAYIEMSHNALPGSSMQMLQAKIEELKETSGNRDFSQGGTSSGVTAASAIAALQEAGSKLSRDMISASYAAFGQMCYMVIERVRQFYQTARPFRIIGQDASQEFVQFDPTQIGLQPQGQIAGIDLGERMPVFDIRVQASRKTAFSRLQQNELAMQLYTAGIFNPELVDQAMPTVDMMDFEGKQKVLDAVRKNGGMMQQLMQMQQAMQQMAMVIDAQNGTALAQGMAMEMGGQQPVLQGGGQTPSVPLDQQARVRAQRTAAPA
jgi:hypothetical protein